MPNSNPACIPPSNGPQNCSNLNIEELGTLYPSIRVSGVSMPLEFVDSDHWQTSSAPLWYLGCRYETDKWNLIGDVDPYVFEDSTGGEFPNLFFPGYSTSANET